MTLPVLCPLRALTGLDCPLCGASRATVELLQGDVAAALDLNALYVLALPLLLATLAWWAVRRRRPSWLAAPAVTPALLAIAVFYGVVRNLPFAPFHYLGS